jgi:hypothetical protein
LSEDTLEALREFEQLEFNWTSIIAILDESPVWETHGVDELVRRIRHEFPTLSETTKLFREEETESTTVDLGSGPFELRLMLASPQLSREDLGAYLWFLDLAVMCFWETGEYAEALSFFPEDFGWYKYADSSLLSGYDLVEKWTFIGGYVKGLEEQRTHLLAPDFVGHFERMEENLRRIHTLQATTNQALFQLAEKHEQVMARLTAGFRDLASIISDESFRRARDDFLAQWEADAPDREEKQVTERLAELCGRRACERLDRETARDLRAYVLLSTRTTPDMVRLAGVALGVAFERELWLALVRAGVPENARPPTLDRLFTKARDLGGRLAAIAEAGERSPGLDALRNRAAHPSDRHSVRQNSGRCRSASFGRASTVTGS